MAPCNIEIHREETERSISGDCLIHITAESEALENLWQSISQGTVRSDNRYWPHEYYNARFLPACRAYRTDRRGYRTLELNEGGMNLSWLRTKGLGDGISMTLESGDRMMDDNEFQNVIRRMRRNIHKLWTKLHDTNINIDSTLRVDGEEEPLPDANDSDIDLLFT